jgi:quercetin dioxygenase-like cupin family protein
MEYTRRVDFARFAAVDTRLVQPLLDRDSGATSCSVSCTKTPPGQGSPARMHTHVVDQLFYILSGTMNLEINGQAYTAVPGTLVVIPTGVPHRNWNGGSETTVHLAFNSPLPSPNELFARPVEVRG